MAVLKAKNFILRKPKLTDAENIYKHQLDAETKRNFISTPKSIKEAKKEISDTLTKKDEDHFVIDVNGKAVGAIGLHNIKQKHSAIISYWLAKEYRGQGIISNAVKLITDYGFKKYKLVRISGDVRTFNKASARVLEKNGYVLEGILKKHQFKDGKYLDDMIYAKIK